MKLLRSATDESRFSAGCLKSRIHSVDEISCDASAANERILEVLNILSDRRVLNHKCVKKFIIAHRTDRMERSEEEDRLSLSKIIFKQIRQRAFSGRQDVERPATWKPITGVDWATCNFPLEEKKEEAPLRHRAEAHVTSALSRVVVRAAWSARSREYDARLHERALISAE